MLGVYQNNGSTISDCRKCEHKNNQSNESKIYKHSDDEDMDISIYKRTGVSYTYISNLSIYALKMLSLDNQDFINYEKSMLNEKYNCESEVRLTEKKIQNLRNSLNVDYRIELKQLAQKQLTLAINKLTSIP
jgi:hypothetical protein